jgi:hypothetical protein
MTAHSDFVAGLADIRRSAEAVGYLVASREKMTELSPAQTQVVLGGLWVLCIGLFQGFLADCLREHFGSPAMPNPQKFGVKHRSRLTERSLDLVNRAIERERRDQRKVALSERHRSRNLGRDTAALLAFVSNSAAPPADAFCVTRALSPNRDFVVELLENLGTKWQDFAAKFPPEGSAESAMLLLESAIQKRHDLAHAATRIVYPTKQELDTLLAQLELTSQAFELAAAAAFAKLR